MSPVEMYLILLSNNPFDILGNPETNKVETNLGVEGTTLFSLTEIATLLKAIIVYGGIVTVIATSILLLYIRKNDKMIAERKEKITRIVSIVWMAGSAVTFFNILKAFLDSIFGFAA